MCFRKQSIVTNSNSNIIGHPMPDYDRFASPMGRAFNQDAFGFSCA